MDKPRKIRDRQGRDVLLNTERWQDIVSAHPEIEVYEMGVLQAVESPTRRRRVMRFASTATASWLG
jgi:hypothetical protein